MKNNIFIYEHRIRYADTDRMGVAYHGRYFEWLEAARTEMLRYRGLPYNEIEEAGILLPVIEAVCRYKRSVYYDEIVQIHTNISQITRSKLRLCYTLTVEGEKQIRAEAETLHCYMSPEGRAVRAPLSLIDQIKSK
ncbi:acyl-CoA thioesterase [bacterium]|nr:acyl-CoA thioesterase [bacterium]